VNVAAVLPHVEVFGGVRRYIEIGNEFVRRGHAFTLFHASGEPPAWLPFLGVTRPYSALADEAFDVGLTSEYSTLSEFDRLRARAKFFYFVLERHKLERDVVRRPYRFLGNSRGICDYLWRRYGLACHRAPGGVNPSIFHPLDARPPSSSFNILCYGRVAKRRKGIQYAIRAVEGLSRRHSNLKLIFFDTLVGRDRRDPRSLIRTDVPYDFHLNLPQSEMAALFGQADLFVSAEWRAGWSNTTAEAMACRLPVVCTPSGTRDFAEDGRTALVAPLPLPALLRRRISRLIGDPALRLRLAEAGCSRVQEFTWARLAERLLALFREL